MQKQKYLCFWLFLNVYPKEISYLGEEEEQFSNFWPQADTKAIWNNMGPGVLKPAAWIPQKYIYIYKGYFEFSAFL